ncbi:mitochondrial transporter fsf1 [Eremomyces bilateralis CBS 781.70]|uniref:Sidoreflexin n=1 Tax=Eremomyces bilateralis CBS 781.70 TaxID=1392243 RepID=A0A6G1G069_9PEZI|nr:mitochondrial transporter fsf1 [Eremomyces bilateralis CBS 781.70]KAF1811433.1 mitochondrial transporter fsf1 [Eremomyces bilateralis CBS 781.70]
MSAALPGTRDPPQSQYDLTTYWGRVRHAVDISDPSTLFVSSAGLENAKQIITAYKTGELKDPTPEFWAAKKIVDSTLHPDTGQPVLLPFRMSCFVISNLVVTAGMLTPGLGTVGTIGWQITNQSLNVAINSSNANKSSPLSTQSIITSYFLAVSASCSVAVGLNSLVPRLRSLSAGTRLILTRLVPFAAVASAGALNVFLMRSSELRKGIDVYPCLSPEEKNAGVVASPVGKSKRAAFLAVGETALSRVLNSTPIMVIPPLILVQLQKQKWMKRRPGLALPVNLGLILGTSLGALPLALGAFPQRQQILAGKLEKEISERIGKDTPVEFNRGI